MHPLKKIALSGLNILLLFACLLLPSKISKGCGPYDYSFYGYSFLNPNIIDLKAPTAAYFAGFKKLFDQIKPKEQIQQTDNIAEWHARFCEIPRIKDLEFVIYKTSITQLRNLKTIMKKKNATLSGLLANNTFARHLQQNKCEEAVDYLIFAKKCEPHVLSSSGWEPLKRDTVRMQFLIKEGLKDFKKTKSHYFKLRYAYQLVRLAHYKKDYAQALTLYDYLMPKIDHKSSIIEDWILGHKAGALMGLGRNVEASYLYSRIFRNTPSKRTSAYRSFRIKTDEEWMECLKLCQNDEERATLYALRANDPNSQAVEEMQKIYEFDPQNAYLELLLAREIQRLEKDLLGLDFNRKKKDNRRIHQIPRKNAGKSLVKLQQLTRLVLEEAKVKNIELWKIADGYLELLGGDFYAARKTLETLKGTMSTPVLEEQLEALIMVANIDGITEVNTEMENLVGTYQKNKLFKKYPDFANFMKDKLIQLYSDNGFKGKAFLEQYTLQQLKYNPQLEIIEELIAICQKENRTKLEDALVLKTDGVTTIESDLWDIKGTHFLSQMQLESALDAYRQMPRKDRDNFGLFNPFREQFHDCINCRIIDTASYNKVDILEQILEFEYKAKADMENGAFYYYQIGNALYNMTYFGYEWEVADYFRSGSSWGGLKQGVATFSNYDAPFGNRETINCSLALYYFDKSFRLARNDELAARAAFMAAKCQQNLFFVQKGSDYSIYGNNIPYVPNEYRQYFNILSNHYQDTEFYEEEVKECLYFERYIARS
jgi:hypothetical protein